MAHDWLENSGTQIPATCPLCTNGALRVMSSIERGTPVSALAEILRGLLKILRAEELSFQPELFNESLFELIHIRGHNQITDALLLAIAVHHNAKLVTFDRNIPWRAVKSATPQHIHLLSA